VDITAGSPILTDDSELSTIRRRSWLGGLLRHYYRDAA